MAVTVETNIAQVDIEVYRGDTWERQFDFADADENPIDLSSWEWAAHLREHADGPLLASFTIDDTAAATGTLVLRLSKTVTEDLPVGQAAWDLERRKEGERRTLVKGSVAVAGDVTRVEEE